MDTGSNPKPQTSPDPAPLATPNPQTSSLDSLSPEEANELVCVLLGERNELVTRLETCLQRCVELEHSLSSRKEQVEAIPPQYDVEGQGELSLEGEDILRHIDTHGREQGRGKRGEEGREEEDGKGEGQQGRDEEGRDGKEARERREDGEAHDRVVEENAVLRKQLEEARKDRDALSLENENYRKARIMLYGEMEGLREKLESTGKRFEEAEKEKDSEKKGWQLESIKLREEIQSLQGLFDAERLNSDSLKNKLQLAETEVVGTKQELEQSKLDLAEVKREMEDLVNQLENARHQAHESEERMQQLLGERDGLRNQIQELEGAVIVDEPIMLGDKVRKFLYSVKEDLEQALHEFRKTERAVPDTESGERENYSLCAALDKIKRALEQTVEEQEGPLPFGDDESLMMVERNNDAVSGVTLIRDGDTSSFPATNPASKFASQDRPFQSVEPQPSFGGSPVPRIDQLANKKLRSEVESYQITPSDYPGEIEAGLKFSARTFGLQEPMIDLETPRGDGIENLLINFQHKYKEMKDYISNRENTIVALESENQHLRERLKLLKPEKPATSESTTLPSNGQSEVADYLKGLSREEIESVVGDLLQRIKNISQTDRRPTDPDFSEGMMTPGSHLITNRDAEPTSVRDSGMRLVQSDNEDPVSEKGDERHKDQGLLSLINQKELELDALHRENEDLKEQIAQLQFASPGFQTADNNHTSSDVAALQRQLDQEAEENERLNGLLEQHKRKSEELLAGQEAANIQLEYYARELQSLRKKISHLRDYSKLQEQDKRDVQQRARLTDSSSCGMGQSPVLGATKSTSPLQKARSRLDDEMKYSQTIRPTYQQNHKENYSSQEQYEHEKENVQYSPRFAATTTMVSQQLKNSFGQVFLQRGLKGIHMRLVEITSRNYHLRTQEAQQVHRDLSMKVIQVDKMIKVLMESLEHYMPGSKNDEVSQRHPEGDLRNSHGKQANKTLTKLTPLNEKHRNQQNTVSDYLSPRNFIQGEQPSPSDRSRSKSHSRLNEKRDQQKVLKSRGSPQPAKEPPAEMPEDSMKLLFKNIQILNDRAKGLVNEYAKIDDNAGKIVTFLQSSYNRSVSPSRYTKFLEQSSLPRVSQTLSVLGAGTTSLYADLQVRTKDWTGHIKTTVNKLKDLVLARRDLLGDLVREDNVDISYRGLTPRQQD